MMNDSSPDQLIPTTKSAAFTLIELLVVIAIIAILMGLLFPAAQNAMNSAYKTAAKNQVVQIATAITAYETEYGALPPFITTNMDSSNTSILCSGTNVSTYTNNNPRGLTFLDSSKWAKGKGGTNSSGFCDPFVSNSLYFVVLDTNYNNTLSNMPYQASPGSSTISTTQLTKHICVWTIWTNGTKKYLIDSWD